MAGLEEYREVFLAQITIFRELKNPKTFCGTQRVYHEAVSKLGRVFVSGVLSSSTL
jgi:hypothetical protein